MSASLALVQDLTTLFDDLYTPAARIAAAPLLVLSVGVLLYLLCDVLLAGVQPVREVVFAAAIACAGWAEWRILVEPPGSVLYGTFVANQATALWGFLFLAATLLAWIHGHGYYRENLPFKPEHDALLLTAPVGMMLMAGAGDLVVFFVGLELLSIPLYALCAFRRSRGASVEAGMKYFLLGSFATALFLYGAALLYAGTGTLALADLAGRDLGSPLALAGLALVAASLFFKAAVFPFQWWAPDVYQGAPTPVTGLMATGTKAAAFAFLVVQITPLLPASAAPVVMALALVTMALGNLGALVQGDLKRMLAYSSVAHAGNLLLLVAAGMGRPDEHGALRAAFYYLAGYLFTAMGAFGILARLELTGARSTELVALRGLARTRPGTSALLALFMLSLGGIPATAGFLGKWFVFGVLVREGWIAAAVVGALLSVIALGYYLRVIVVLYMQPALEGVEPPARSPWSVSAAGAVCAAFVLAMGLLPSWFLHLLD